MDGQEEAEDRFVKADRLVQGLAMALMRLGVELDIRGVDDSRWLNVVRQLYVLSSLGRHHFISIAGEQGAGKTLLARNLYPDAGAWLEDNSGRGEKYPVAIVEVAGLEEPRGVVFFRRSGTDAERSGELTLKRTYSTGHREEWRRHVQGDDARVLLTQLEVPMGFLNLEGTGFVLLPGLERGAAQPQWQELMKIVLATSPAALLVVDERRLANAGQPELLRHLRQAGEEPRLVVAVTRCESSSSEVVAERTARAVEVFGVAEADVVPVGKDGSSPEGWTNALRARIDAKRGSDRANRRLETDLLRSLIRHDLAGVLRSARAARDRKALDSSIAETIQEQLDQFDEASDGLRRTLAYKVTEYYNAHMSRAGAELTRLVRESGGWRELLLRTEENVRGRRNERDARLAELVKRAWLTPSDSRQDGLPGPNAAYLESIEATVEAERQIRIPSFTTSLTDGRLNRDVALVLTGRAPGHGIDAHTGSTSGTQPPPSRSDAPDLSGMPLSQAVRALPVMTLDARAFAIGELVQPDGSMSTTTSPEELSGRLRALADERKALLGAFGLLLGTERFAEEDIDLVANVGRLSAGLFGGGTGLAGAGAAASGALLTALGVGAVGVTLLNAANVAMRERERLARSLLEAHKEAAQRRVLENVDELLRLTREVLRARLQQALGADATLNRQFRLESALQAVESYRERMLEALGHDELG
ncbi:hypothetical protein [Streptomyces sp. NPDC052701]|uniref:hypothetical protein n=1 Tax=Streptomyces sp. NPDC052701 TaxID=3155533 RepID=UPI003419EC38